MFDKCVGAQSPFEDFADSENSIRHSARCKLLRSGVTQWMGTEDEMVAVGTLTYKHARGSLK